MDLKNKNIEIKRHSLAHLLAMAVREKHPDIKFGIGPAIENGFYYDFDFSKIGHSPSQDCLPKLEKEMRELIKKGVKFERREISAKKAKKIFVGQPFKLELIDELKKSGEKILIYKSGNFIDLCAGPHVKSTKEINPDAFKLTKIAGAYWKGNEKNPMLQRIYGAAFETKKDLQDYLNLLAEAEKRDHRKLGKELDLFVFSDLVGKGLPLWTEKGAIIRREMEKFIVDEEIKRGYRHVITSDIANVRLYEVSGHYPYYKDSMYPAMEIDGEKLILRPMSCPHHFTLYQDKIRSYKELPLKIAELAKLYRYEKSGELAGLIRIRSFCLADSHIFSTEKQVEGVINEVLDLIEYANGVLGFKKGKDYIYRLSLGDRKNAEKYFKNDKAWAIGEKTLRSVLKKRQEDFIEAKGEAAFYGPKIDIQMKNVLGKENTAFTVQYDFCLPTRFKLRYIDEDGKEKQPVVIHRSSVGAIERTIAFLIEKYAGALPLWLSPIQTTVIPISEKSEKYGEKILAELKKNNIRAELAATGETLGKRIREAELLKIPYILIVGEKEEKLELVAVRERDTKKQGTIKLQKFVGQTLEQILKKS